MVSAAGTQDLAPKPLTGFAGQRILVTGATGFIGRETVRILAHSGASLVITGRDKAKLNALRDTLPRDTACDVSPLDLMQGDEIPGWMRDLAEKGGPFSGVAHIAGIYGMRSLASVDAAFIATMLDANVTSAIMISRGFRHKTCHTENASLVLVSASASLRDGGDNVVYAASKGAITAAAKGMAHELVRDKIRVNCVVPALMESDMLDHIAQTLPPGDMENLRGQYPMGFGKPTDAAQAIVYLLSARSRWMTGSTMQVDGGLSLGSR